jgi:hypothetical protein
MITPQQRKAIELTLKEHGCAIVPLHFGNEHLVPEAISALGDLFNGGGEKPEADSKEWEAHRELLFGEWKPDTRDQQLRQIVQYARSGPFYPADMHVQLIKEVYEQ